ncbi:sigma-54-dependent Fis family transcriptional regulator [Candidatus Endobugula sertula]|uniref:Sigma-54-dependent Fis family transcriptional regulator n=1 Tax=Candidatus Endobugula sertula TaxID=62101 RepID=A0A1D2QT03_9GAMM|nr:sigma-54-dependent Fis family transcriptional regulator [Candidatus Endobugula sertula]
MWENSKLIIIDDDIERRRSLDIILEFLGESTIVSGDFEWQEKVDMDEDSKFIAVVVGHCRRQSSLESRLRQIAKWNDGVAIILLGQSINGDLEGIDLDLEIKQQVIATLDTLPTYNKLIDILHRAQCFYEAKLISKRQSTRRPPHLFRSLVGNSCSIQSVREMMTQVADKDVTVLVTGESGTGKEVVARNLHYHSTRCNGPFVPVNCGAIPAELLESELFGHEKGAFTGAISARAGRFEMAEGGTLFLDEIGDMPLNMQVKILRVLQEKCYERVGSNKSQKTNVRIIAATHRHLENMIEEGSFREDLYYRLNVFPIEMPSLNERREDIPVLLNEILARLENEKRGSVRFNSTSIMSLCQHLWSGNVRELANLVERMAIMYPYGVIGVNDLPAKYRHIDVTDETIVLPEEESMPSVVNMNSTALLPDSGIDLKEYLTSLEQDLIQQALDNSGGVVARAAERLMIRRTTLVEKMRKYGLQRIQ